MKKKLICTLSLFAALGCLASCNNGNKPSSKPSDEQPSTSTIPERKYVSPYEHEFVYYAPGKIYNSETKTEGEANTLASQAFETSKHKGPNYMIYIRLLKEANGEKSVKAGRRILFQNGDLLNAKIFETTGSWEKQGDSYTINLDGFEGRGSVNENVTLTSTADGKVNWTYYYNTKEYVTSLYTSASFIGEYTGTFTNMEGQINPVNEVVVDFKDEDNSLYTRGSFNDTGIGAFEGAIDEFGCVMDGKITRLDGSFVGLFYTDLDGKAKFNCSCEARERTSTVRTEII